jgi:hypothetical protein
MQFQGIQPEYTTSQDIELGAIMSLQRAYAAAQEMGVQISMPPPFVAMTEAERRSAGPSAGLPPIISVIVPPSNENTTMSLGALLAHNGSNAQASAASASRQPALTDGLGPAISGVTPPLNEYTPVSSGALQAPNAPGTTASTAHQPAGSPRSVEYGLGAISSRVVSEHSQATSPLEIINAQPDKEELSVFNKLFGRVMRKQPSIRKKMLGPFKDHKRSAQPVHEPVAPVDSAQARVFTTREFPLKNTTNTKKRPTLRVGQPAPKARVASAVVDDETVERELPGSGAALTKSPAVSVGELVAVRPETVAAGPGNRGISESEAASLEQDPETLAAEEGWLTPDGRSWISSWASRVWSMNPSGQNQVVPTTQGPRQITSPTEPTSSGLGSDEATTAANSPATPPADSSEAVEPQSLKAMLVRQSQRKKATTPKRNVKVSPQIRPHIGPQLGPRLGQKRQEAGDGVVKPQRLNRLSRMKGLLSRLNTSPEDTPSISSTVSRGRSRKPRSKTASSKGSSTQAASSGSLSASEAATTDATTPTSDVPSPTNGTSRLVRRATPPAYNGPHKETCWHCYATFKRCSDACQRAPKRRQKDIPVPNMLQEWQQGLPFWTHSPRGDSSELIYIERRLQEGIQAPQDDRALTNPISLRSLRPKQKAGEKEAVSRSALQGRWYDSVASWRYTPTRHNGVFARRYSYPGYTGSTKASKPCPNEEKRSHKLSLFLKPHVKLHGRWRPVVTADGCVNTKVSSGLSVPYEANGMHYLESKYVPEPSVSSMGSGVISMDPSSSTDERSKKGVEVSDFQVKLAELEWSTDGKAFLAEDPLSKKPVPSRDSRPRRGSYSGAVSEDMCDTSKLAALEGWEPLMELPALENRPDAWELPPCVSPMVSIKSVGEGPSTGRFPFPELPSRRTTDVESTLGAGEWLATGSRPAPGTPVIGAYPFIGSYKDIVCVKGLPCWRLDLPPQKVAHLSIQNIARVGNKQSIDTLLLPPKNSVDISDKGSAQAQYFDCPSDNDSNSKMLQEISPKASISPLGSPELVPLVFLSSPCAPTEERSNPFDELFVDDKQLFTGRDEPYTPWKKDWERGSMKGEAASVRSGGRLERALTRIMSEQSAGC